MALQVFHGGTHLHGVDVVALRHEVQGVRDENDGLAAVAESTYDGVGEKCFPNVCVH